MSRPIDDADLGAWLDGELDPVRRDAVEQALREDPTLAARIEALRGLQDDLRALHDPVLDEPVPDRLTALLQAPAPPSGGNVVTMPSRRRPAFFVPASLAASLALVIGFGGGWLLRGPPGAEPGGALDMAGLSTVLETAPGGATVQLAGGGEVTPVLTFRAAGERWCREFHADGTDPAVGIACRADSGWQLVAWLRETSVEPNADGYIPAHGPELAGLDPLLDALVVGEPLGPDDEARLLEGGWPEP